MAYEQLNTTSFKPELRESGWGTKIRAFIDKVDDQIKQLWDGKSAIGHVHDPSSYSVSDIWTPNQPAIQLDNGEEIAFGKLDVPTGTKLVIDSLGIRDMDGTSEVTDLEVVVYNETTSTEVTSSTSARATSSSEVAAGNEVVVKLVNNSGSTYTVVGFVRAHFETV